MRRKLASHLTILPIPQFEFTREQSRLGSQTRFRILYTYHIHIILRKSACNNCLGFDLGCSLRLSQYIFFGFFLFNGRLEYT